MVRNPSPGTKSPADEAAPGGMPDVPDLRTGLALAETLIEADERIDAGEAQTYLGKRVFLAAEAG